MPGRSNPLRISDSRRFADPHFFIFPAHQTLHASFAGASWRLEAIRRVVSHKAYRVCADLQAIKDCHAVAATVSKSGMGRRWPISDRVSQPKLPSSHACQNRD